MGDYISALKNMNDYKKSQDGVGVCLASLSYHPLYSGPAVRFQRYAPGLADRGIRMSVFTQAVTATSARRRGLVPNGLESNG